LAAAVSSTRSALPRRSDTSRHHAFSGSGDELQKARQIADALAKSDPKSGYSQVLHAEALSTWRLDQKGQPADIRDQVLALADEAIKLNPNLAQAHVAKARALVRSSLYERANASIDAALKLEPNLSGALFLRAQIFRRTGAISEAEAWHKKFIDSTPHAARKANGYGWLGTMYEEAGAKDPANRAAWTAKARTAYENEIRIAPEGAWRNRNFAVFLNDHAADFDAAERYAQKALSMKDEPKAKYHWAAAKYQKLGVNAAKLQGAKLVEAVDGIAKATRVSLSEAIKFQEFSGVVRGRLKELQARLQRS
jgi:tetratricopeptide (TPR) repeat protein